MKCPLCSQHMELKKGRCKYGMEIRFHQCSGCGGLWGDPGNFYRTDSESAKEIAHIDVEAFQERRKSHDTLSCPECDVSLVPVSDTALPKHIDLERCPQCEGIWAKANTFLAYHTWRGEQKKKRTKRSSEQDEMMKKFEGMMEVYAGREKGGRYLTALADVLTTPISRPAAQASFIAAMGAAGKHIGKREGLIVAIVVLAIFFILTFIMRSIIFATQG